MNKQNRFQTILLLVLVAAVVCMSIGFAAYSRVLNINGAVKVSSSKWSVHFDPTTFQEAAGSVEATSVNAGDTVISFSAPLAKIGDKYEFDVNVINDGTLDAKLKSITLSGLSEEQAKYISYVVTYDGTNYSATTENMNNIIAAQGTKTVHVLVTYIQPANSEDLPQSDVNLNLTAAFNYEQL